MKNMKKKVGIVLSAAACLCVGAVATSQLSADKVTASAAVEPGFTTTTVQMLNKGSIRMDATRHGIRFATFIGNDVDLASTYGENYKIGTLFIPEGILDAAEKTVEDLEADASFVIGGEEYFPAKAITDGATATLTTDPNYEGGQLFCAVLDLSDLDMTEADFLNTKIVARTFIQKNDGSYVYNFGSAERSPAGVAATMLDSYAVSGESDDSGTLVTYVDKLYFTNTRNQINVEIGQDVAGPVPCADDVPFTYEIGKSKVYRTDKVANCGDNTVRVLAQQNGDKIQGLRQGRTEMKATAAGGLVESINTIVNVSEPMVTFNAPNYTPEGNFVFACAPGTLSFEGETLVEDTDYTRSEGYIVLPKEKIVDNMTAAGTYELTVTVTEHEVAKEYVHHVNVYKPSSTNFSAGQLGGEIFDSTGARFDYQQKKIVSVSGVNRLEVGAFGDGGTKWGRVNLHADYLGALFSYPELNALQIRYYHGSGTNGTAIPYLAADGTIATQNIGYAANQRTIWFSRATWERLKYGEYDGNLRMTIGVGDVDRLQFVSIKTYSKRDVVGTSSYESNLFDSNTIYADKPADGKLSFQLTPNAGTPTSVGVGTADAPTVTADTTVETLGNLFAYDNASGVATITDSATLPMFNRSAATVVFIAQTNAGGTYNDFYIVTTETPAAEQTFAQATGYTYPLANIASYEGAASLATAEGHENATYQIISATLDGQDILAGEVEGVSVTREGIEFTNTAAVGTHRLVVKVLRRQKFSTASPAQGNYFTHFTFCDTHDRQITITE